MTFSITRTRKTADGNIADGQLKLQQDRLDIGASNEQDIQLEWPNVRLRHASLQYESDRLQLIAHSEQGVKLNGDTVQQAWLKNGDEFEIGNHHFNIQITADELELTVTVDETLTTSHQREFNTRLAHTGFSKRRWSWGLLLSISIGFLVIPLIQRYSLNPADPVPLLPSHSLWNSGEFHPAHQFFADDCSQCHQQPFAQVKNNACMACHEDIAAHADPSTFAIDELQQADCQNCHKEHNGSNELVTSDKQLCLSCHQDIHGFTDGESKQVNIYDWRQSHPEISLRMPQWRNDNGWQWQQFSAAEQPQESSGLVFPHDIHLDPAGLDIDGGQTKVMQCNDCHQPEPGGKGMQDINMETHCDSCHRLDFDADNPDLFVRHGDVAATLRDIAGLKGLNQLKTTLSGEATKAPTEPALKRPGKDPKQRQQALTLIELASELIEKRGCVTCHSISRDESAIATGDLINGWRIAPVHINSRWIDHAEFDHAGHQSMACIDCHSSVQQSELAEDVLIPSRENCLSCHGNPGDSGLINSQCIDCHSYHLPQHGWLSPDGETP